MSKFSSVIIIGSGIGGLCSAAAIAPHADRVEIFCKDERPDGPSVRKSVPQGAHISILLQAGLNNLEVLFPGIGKELVNAGAAEIQAGTGQQIHEFGRWQPERALDLTFLGLSRPLLEHHIYLRVKKIPAISISNQSRIRSLNVNSEGDVCGVHGERDGKTFSANAELVIDASGIGGHFVKQIADIVNQSVETEQRQIGIFYSTAQFQKPQSFRGRKENILIVPEAGQTDMGGSLIDIEEEKWCISLHGRNNASPPGNPHEWMAMAKSLPDTRIWARAVSGDMIGDIRTFKKPISYWRRFEKCPWLPSGYLPVGDVISSVNPIFGQGITIATGHALALSEALAGNTNGKTFYPSYLKKAAEYSGMAWRKTQSYDENLDRLESMPEHKKRMLKELAKVRHQQITDNPDAHLRLVRQSQMLV